MEDKDKIREMAESILGDLEKLIKTEDDREPPLDLIALKFEQFNGQPRHYYRDGTPILNDEVLPAMLKWSALFENFDYKIVKQSRTLYGEKLSTVWLGLDHSFQFGPHEPLIFETMLFKAERDDKGHMQEDENHIQRRYATEQKAREGHKELRLMCLIPPRWRHFLLGTVAGLNEWKNWDEIEEK